MPNLTARGVVVRDGREIACGCFCHVEPALHIMACCHEPKTDAGRASLAAVTELEASIDVYGGVSAQVQRFRLVHPELDGVVETIVAHWRQGRL